METTAAVETKTEETPEQKGIQQQIGVIAVVERLFRGVDAGTFPLRAHDDVMAGMNFLAQFHKQLLAQLPEDVRTKLQAEAANGTK